MVRENLRNVAIIAHVDHGKTTLVDQMLKQSGTFRDNQVVADRVMDSGDLEKERGITILAKNTAINYEGIKINIIDTPGHADFGGEVERVLEMVDGVILLVDSFEGPMPQTRFVLSKALSMGLKVIVAVNKTDRPDARNVEVTEEVYELLFDLNATDEQLESKVIYCSGRLGKASLKPGELGEDLTALMHTLLQEIPKPEGDENAPLQLLVSSLDYNEYVGRICVGKITRGTLKQGQEVTICDYHSKKAPRKGKVVNLYQIEGLSRVASETATVGDIVCVSGIEDITIGDTICQSGNTEALPFVSISEPTVEMTFAVNDSPFAGKDGKYLTSRHLRERLFKETLKDVSLRITETESSESFKVAGRGEMHLSILIETMRREGYEFQVSTPQVLIKVIDGKKFEPFENLVVDVPDECVGSVMEKMGLRKGELTLMNPVGGRTRLDFIVPSRGLFGYRSEFMTATKGDGIMSSVFAEYRPYSGEIQRRSVGSLVAFETGETVTYGLYNAQERGTLFLGPAVPIYEGMVVGESPKSEDLVVNVCKKKHVSNMRASGSDDALRLTPPKTMSLEQSIEFITDDELIEITPKSIRIRKKVLDKSLRAKAYSKSKN